MAKAKVMTDYKISISKMPTALRLFNLSRILKKSGFNLSIDINNPENTDLLLQLESIAYMYDNINSVEDELKDALDEVG